MSDHFDIDDTDPTDPTIDINTRSKYSRQYFKYVRSGALRIGASSDDAAFEPLGFINRDGQHVVVVKTTRGDDLTVNGLAAGTYGISYTISAAVWGVELLRA